jgi:hypothetical protein
MSFSLIFRLRCQSLNRLTVNFSLFISLSLQIEADAQCEQEPNMVTEFILGSICFELEKLANGKMESLF